MEARQAEDGDEEDGDDAHDHDGEDGGDGLQLLRLLVVDHIDETEDEDAGHVDGEGDEEHEEVAVVPAADTVVDPGAVVVEYLDTIVADAAVGTSGRPVKLAGHTPLHPHLVREGVVVVGMMVAEEVVAVVVWGRWWWW